MAISDDFIQQAQDWLLAADDQREVRLLLDFPQSEWLIVEAMDCSEDTLRLTVRATGSMGLIGEPYELLCRPADIRAAKHDRTWKAKMEDASNSIPF